MRSTTNDPTDTTYTPPPQGSTKTAGKTTTSTTDTAGKTKSSGGKHSGGGGKHGSGGGGGGGGHKQHDLAPDEHPAAEPPHPTEHETALVPSSPVSQLSPLAYAGAGAVTGYVVASFLGVHPLFGAVIGGGGGYLYGTSQGGKP